jgi:hypothetical protein
MGGFTNDELDGLNLGKNYKYPDTTQIENTASTILPTIDDDNTVFKFTVSVLFLMGILMCLLYYFRYNNMNIANFFKSLRDKMQMTTRGVRVSTKTMVMPK